MSLPGSKRSKRQRGVAATEFALVLVPMLILTGTIATLGRAFYAEYMLLNIANTSVRACTLQQQNLHQPQPPPDNSALIEGCVGTAFQQVMTQYQNVCGGAQVTPSYNRISLPKPAGSAYFVDLMQIQLSCNMPVYFVPNFASFPITAQVAMPFINGN